MRFFSNYFPSEVELSRNGPFYMIHVIWTLFQLDLPDIKNACELDIIVNLCFFAALRNDIRKNPFNSKLSLGSKAYFKVNSEKFQNFHF